MRRFIKIIKEVIEDLQVTKMIIILMIICCGLVWIYLEKTFHISFLEKTFHIYLRLATFDITKYTIWMKSIALLVMMVSLILYAYAYIKWQWKQSVISKIGNIFSLSHMIFLVMLFFVPQIRGNDWEWVLIFAVLARDYIVKTGEKYNQAKNSLR